MIFSQVRSAPPAVDEQLGHKRRRCCQISHFIFSNISGLLFFSPLNNDQWVWLTGTGGVKEYLGARMSAGEMLAPKDQVSSPRNLMAVRGVFIRLLQVANVRFGVRTVKRRGQKYEEKNKKKLSITESFFFHYSGANSTSCPCASITGHF